MGAGISPGQGRKAWEVHNPLQGEVLSARRLQLADGAGLRLRPKAGGRGRDPEEDLRQYIALKSIYNAKWENATFTIKAIKDEIMECKIKAKEAIEVIKSMGSEKQDEALEMYKLTRDLTECLKFIQRYEAQKREILEREEARRKQEEEERIRREERAKIEAENQRKEDEQRHQEALQEAQEEARNEFIDSLIPEEVEGENEVVYTYDIKLTDAKKEALELFMNSVGIEYDLLTLPM